MCDVVRASVALRITSRYEPVGLDDDAEQLELRERRRDARRRRARCA